MKHDGASLRKLRTKLNMNQHEFYGRLGVTQSGGSRYETGRVIPVPVRLLVDAFYGSERELQAVMKRRVP